MIQQLFGVSRLLPKRKHKIQKDICCPVFSAALFTQITKIWKPLKHPSIDECLRAWHVPTMKYYSAIKKLKSTCCDNMDGSRVHYKNEVQTERQKTIWSHLYVIYRQTKQNDRFIDENSWWGSGRMGRLGKGIKDTNFSLFFI